VLARYHGVTGWPGAPAVERRLWEFARRHVQDAALPRERIADYTQAQMDLGATICTRARPSCGTCPLQSDCVARIEGLACTLPTPRPQRELPHREALALVVRDASGRILLQRRPPVGVWPALWSLPQFDSPVERDAWVAAHLQAARDFTDMPPVAHAFSHYRLTLHPVSLGASLADTVGERDDVRFVDAGDARGLGIPAPIRRLIGPLLET
jgi:A/G-specific adenine glycosylase